MNRQYQSGDVLETTIEKIVPRGYGLGFAEELTLFVALAATGDRLRVRLREIKGKTAFAEIEEILEPSRDRTDPICPYFGECGGCNFQQLKYAAQLDAKIAMVRDCLERIGKIDAAIPIEMVPCPEPFGYRLRTQWHVGPDIGRIGYYRRNSRDLVEIEHCAVLAPRLDALLGELRTSPNLIIADTTVQIDAACGETDETSMFSPDLPEPTQEITWSAGGEKYIFTAEAFFQGNRFQLDRLIKSAIREAAGGTALDLYCGVGLFTIPLARRFERVVGIEENGAAIDFAKRNAEAANLENVELHRGSVRQFLANYRMAMPDFVLLDPPRAGTEKETILDIISLQPRHVSYVACEPSVLARDLKRFVENGYQIESLTVIDLFPQTHHVETIAHLYPE